MSAIGCLVKILVDVEEQRSPVPAELDALGVAVEVARLPVGDYVVATDATVERKTVSGLHESLVSGRLWSQIFALRRVIRRPYLLVEGDNIDAGRISSRGVRGALLRIAAAGVPIIRSANPSDTALWIYLVATREQATDALQLVHLYAERGSPKFESAARRWLVRYLTEGTPGMRDVAKVTSSLATRERVG